MRRFAIQLAILCASALSSAVLAAPAPAAAPLHLGQTAISSTGSCGLCSVLQFEDSGSPTTYEMPSDGVFTRFSVYVGSEINANDKVQLRTFRKISASSAKVISEGSQHSLNGSTPGVANTFYDRVPAKAGDVLGARFDIAAHGVGATPPSFSTGSGSDSFAVELGGVSDPAVGDTFSPAFSSEYRANVSAWLEPDVDDDGYGDISQDLCPGSQIATSACSGTLFGSRLQGEPSFRAACGYECMRIQKTVGGISTAAPYDGVVVRWRVLAVPAGSYKIRALGPAGGTKYTVLQSSDTGVVGSDGQFSLTTFQSRLPIPAGGYVGLVPPPFGGSQNFLPAAGSSFQQVDDGADGSSGDFAGYGSSSGEALYDADIEPDADHDGYGDVTQDSCPSSASVHEGPCPPTPTSGAGTRPQITGFKVVPKSFRVKPGGAVVSSGKGAKLALTLSAAATVAFAIESKLVCKPAKKVAHRCKPGFRKVHTFSRSLPHGANSLPYSGRYKSAGKVKSLKPGAYRVTAVASSAGGSSAPARTAFTVLR